MTDKNWSRDVCDSTLLRYNVCISLKILIFPSRARVRTTHLQKKSEMIEKNRNTEICHYQNELNVLSNSFRISYN